MLLFVGLGNPGSRFEKTRHNAGFMWVDEFLRSLTLTSAFDISGPDLKENLYLLWTIRTRLGNVAAYVQKPLTFMNLSGKAVSFLANKYKIPADNIYIAHDDLDLKLGTYKITKNKFPKTHKGLKSIQTMLGKTEFWYIRLGVDSRTPQTRLEINPEDYVLMKMTPEELELLNKSIKDSIRKLWQLKIFD